MALCRSSISSHFLPSKKWNADTQKRLFVDDSCGSSLWEGCLPQKKWTKNCNIVNIVINLFVCLLFILSVTVSPILLLLHLCYTVEWIIQAQVKRKAAKRISNIMPFSRNERSFHFHLAELFEYSLGLFFFFKSIVRWKRNRRKGGKERLNSSFSSVWGSVSGKLRTEVEV